MAILRGGKRIGGIDVRIGIPRDRSLDNVTGDPRLKRPTGGNPETNMGRFQSYVNEAEGFARPNRYYVEFFLPKGLSDEEVAAATPDGDFDLSSNSLETNFAFPSPTELRGYQNANARRVQAFCSAISMPDRTAKTTQIRHGNAPKRNVVYDFDSGNISATFYADKFLRERTYFELWQNSGFSTTSFNMNYYKNYVSDVTIYQLGQFASRQERDDVTYGVKLFDCYPTNLSKVDYSHDGTTDVQTFNVDFSFRYWVNFFITKTGEVELGQSTGNVPTIKEQKGLAGLLGKLPPEARRAGRDVLNALRRRVPYGQITGGRAFPPFKLPPLKL